MKKWLIIILALIVFGILFSKWFFNQHCEPPKKPNGVPVSAVWKGGCDGGNWIELVSIKNDTLRFKIYRDWNGDLLLDADFEYVNCNSFRLTASNWVEHIAYFGEALEIYEKLNVGKCRLTPITPVYYQEKLE